MVWMVSAYSFVVGGSIVVSGMLLAGVIWWVFGFKKICEEQDAKELVAEADNGEMYEVNKAIDEASLRNRASTVAQG
ncbi:unnamed protein product [Callosobruchus maculatus]|uniref:Uncharacterized protein n=1 Tax=Callosobruchus maculatus TaxID=64391 RepID=A0A653D796_CALMS|nr:unnamed protein product [Callosobruchus maculatus]